MRWPGKMRHAPPLLAAATVLACGSAADPRRRRRPMALVRIGRSTSSSLGNVRGKARCSMRAAASSTISPAAPARAIRCDFRQVSELDNGEGKVSLSAICAPPLGGRRGQGLRFHSQNYLNENLLDSVDGQAERAAGGVAVALTKPSQRKLDLEARSCFRPSTSAASSPPRARAKRILQFSVYDGSETGEKVYDTLTVIGKASRRRARARRCHLRQGTSRGIKSLAGDDELLRPRGKPAGEQTPVYAISFELYENGVSRTLDARLQRLLDQRRAEDIELKDSKPCP